MMVGSRQGCGVIIVSCGKEIRYFERGLLLSMCMSSMSWANFEQAVIAGLGDRHRVIKNIVPEKNAIEGP